MVDTAFTFTPVELVAFVRLAEHARAQHGDGGVLDDVVVADADRPGFQATVTQLCVMGAVSCFRLDGHTHYRLDATALDLLGL